MPVRRRTPRYLGPGAVVVVLGLAAAGVVGSRAAKDRQGVLVTNSGSADSGVVAVRQVGESICYGMVMVHNPSAEPVTLKSVEVTGGDGVTVGPAMVLTPQREVPFSALVDRCPAGGAALSGHVVPPDADVPGSAERGTEILLPLTVTRPGKHRITGVTVTYRQGGDTRRVTNAINVVTCTTACDGRPE